MSESVRKRCIAVLGGGLAKPQVNALSEALGGAIARAGCDLICGGLGGAMEAACRGAKAEGGLTIGVLPAEHRFGANPYVDVAVATGLGDARGMVIARSCDALIAVDGRFGTLTEIAWGLQLEKPVVGIGTWAVTHPTPGVKVPIMAAESAEEAVQMALTRLRAHAWPSGDL